METSSDFERLCSERESFHLPPPTKSRTETKEQNLKSIFHKLDKERIVIVTLVCEMRLSSHDLLRHLQPLYRHLLGGATLALAELERPQGFLGGDR